MLRAWVLSLFSKETAKAALDNRACDASISDEERAREKGFAPIRSQEEIAAEEHEARVSSRRQSKLARLVDDMTGKAP